MAIRSKRPAPTWAIFAPTELELPAQLSHKLLGSIIADIENPSHEYCPEDVKSILDGLVEAVEVQDSNVETELSSAENAGARARLQTIFRIEADRSNSSDTTLKSETVITRTLQQQRKVFNAIIATYKDTVLKLLKDNSGRGYMVVGIKTCVDAEISTNNGMRRFLEGSLGIPISTTLLHGTDIVLGGTANPDIGGMSEKIRKALTTRVATGERIYSIQYRQIWRKRERLLSPLHVAEYGKLFPVDPRRAAFSSEEDTSEEEDDGEDDDQSGHNTVELGKVVHEGPAKLLFASFK
jgi:hypothetical protein